MSSRYGIAVQAIGVAALATIVYLAFLSPDDPNPLTGIEVDGGLPSQQAMPGKRSQKGDGQKGDGQNGTRRPKRDRARAQPPVTIRLTPSLPSGPSTPLPIDTETPADEQYTDTAARILDRVARAQP